MSEHSFDLQCQNRHSTLIYFCDLSCLNKENEKKKTYCSIMAGYGNWQAYANNVTYVK